MFEGVHTALVTPFTKSGDVDFDRLRHLVRYNVEGGVDGLAPVGTTGESPTLTYQEHLQVIETVLDEAGDKVPIIAGSGANSTAEALELTREARKLGAHGTLQVTPYYNKPNQEGLYRHFSSVADEGLPVVLYNVPGRTGREIALETVKRLGEHPQIVAIKEAAGSVARASQIVTQSSVEVLCGDDNLTYPMMAVGGVGVISVASNMAPGRIAEMVYAQRKGNAGEAQRLHQELYPLFEAVFFDTNPISVKAAMGLMGLLEPTYRGPLCEPSDEVKERLKGVLDHFQMLP